MADYVLSARAVADLEEIYDYTEREFGHAQAVSYLSGLEERFRQLAIQPALAPGIDDIRPGYRRYLFEQHAIYFQVDGWDVFIVRVFHQRMLPSQHF